MSDIETTSPEVSTTTEAAAPVATVEAKETTASTESVQPEVSTAEVKDVSTDVNFLDSLSSELKVQKALKDFKDVNGLAKSYLHLNSMIGKKVSDLSPEELGQVYGKMGRPEAADEYSMPDKMNEDASGWYKEAAHKLGMSQDQARGLAESFMELEDSRSQERDAAAAKVQEEWSADIKKEFGGAFDQRIETAKKAIEAFGGNDLRDAMDESGLGNHPAMVKAFAKIGKEMLEGGLTQPEATSAFGITPEDAKMKIANLKRDPEFMKSYMSAMHPSHDAAVKEIQGYHAIVSGGE